MLQTNLIKQKIRSVANIRKIAETMEMISVSKMKKAIWQAESGKEYATTAFGILNYIAKEKHLQTYHEFFKKRNPGKKLIMVVASDKGLCGAFNLNIYKKLSSFKEKFGEALDCIAVGLWAEKIANKLGLPIKASFLKVSSQNVEDESRALTKIIMNSFQKEPYENVYILYTRFIKASQTTPSIKDILPIDQEIMEEVITETDSLKILESHKIKAEKELSEKGDLSLCLFEPSEEMVLEYILPKLTGAIIYHALLESLASEHSARMFAMKAASDNADEIFNDLKVYYNRARQESITKELSEIVSGAESLK